jgi:hypothetical protein
MADEHSDNIRRPEGTPVFAGPHRRSPHAGPFWRIVGLAALIVVAWLVFYIVHRTPLPAR